MVKIRWTREAVSDLESIFKYIARDSVQYARLQAAILCESVEKLGIYPRLGRRLPEFPHLVHRETIVGSYRIIYRHDIESKAIHIVAIVHGRRLLKNPSL
jgi:toxin ParE1/3/4